ncbi:glycoside hydrolase family 97 protein [Flavihumibacter sp. R14]|nr:glycoside hydrolase family 97 protein [Flavihumibacter soli]
MKTIVLFICCAFLSIPGFAQLLTLHSPDKKIKVNISLGSELKYEVFIDNKPVIIPSLIDMHLLSGQKLSAGLKISKQKTASVNETILSLIPEKRKPIANVFNELALGFANKFGVIFRAYNDGVAYRITSKFKGDVLVGNEKAIFNFPQGYHAYAPIIQKRTDQDIFHTSFEELYSFKALDSLTVNDQMYSPVLIAAAENVKIGIIESDLDDYPGMHLKGTGGPSLTATFAGYPLEESVATGEFPQSIVTKRADYIAKTRGSRSFPWRVLILSREDKELPSNDLVYRLAPPSKLKDVSWLSPGKSTEEWIIDINLFNVPFKSGINTATYKYYIDFAKAYGLDRIMMDAGWSDYSDLFKINPAMNMDSIAAYARSKGIRLSMWTLALTLDRQLDGALKQFNKWGVDFIMTDFIDRDDQKMVNFHERITKACADAQIMLMFHGSYPQKGFNRTYPNDLTREGVLGSEYNIWSDKVTARHNVTIPFTRMLAGPMDYEPGLLDNATPAQFAAIKGKVMSQTTRSQQLAMFVVYDSPLQMFSGNPSQAFLEPDFMKLLGGIPTTWDNTLILDARVAEYIVTARQSGESWYIAGMTGDKAKDITINLGFLPEARYQATICKDGINAEKNAADYILQTTSITNAESLPVHMAPGGGFLIKLSPDK